MLLLGPLYHLQDRGERIAALAEARRVARTGGVVAAAAIVLDRDDADAAVREHVEDRLPREAVHRKRRRLDGRQACDGQSVVD